MEGILRKATQAGDQEAALDLAQRLLDGRGAQLAPAEGEEILRSLAECNNIDAMTALLKRLMTGNGIAQSRDEAIALLGRLSAIVNNPSITEGCDPPE